MEGNVFTARLELYSRAIRYRNDHTNQAGSRGIGGTNDVKRHEGPDRCRQPRTRSTSQREQSGMKRTWFCIRVMVQRYVAPTNPSSTAPTARFFHFAVGVSWSIASAPPGLKWLGPPLDVAPGGGNFPWMFNLVCRALCVGERYFMAVGSLAMTSPSLGCVRRELDVNQEQPLVYVRLSKGCRWACGCVLWWIAGGRRLRTTPSASTTLRTNNLSTLAALR